MARTQEMTYKQRWLRVFLKIVERRGRIWALGFAVGIIARRTRVDWDLRRDLGALETELGFDEKQ